MATLQHSESRRLYSWWWDSHNSPKNSKWLQENLTDMDAKVKAMIKLIEEDADSFARRAEMYYKKRPELMKLVEEFYRAYRALAERYNHATGELRQAHRTMAQAFPDQVPFALADDTASSSSEPDTPEASHPIRSLFDPDFQGQSTSSSQSRKRTGAYSEDSSHGIGRKGLKQLHDIFGSTEVGAEDLKSAGGGKKLSQISPEENSLVSQENQKLKSQILDEAERASKAEKELQSLRQALAKLEAERDSIFLQYQESLEKLSDLEKDLSHAQKESKSLDELVSEAKTEVQALKEMLKNLGADRDASLLQYRKSSEQLAIVEGLLSEACKDTKELSEQAANAELESQKSREELARLEAEKEASELLYKQCLKKISASERELAVAEESLKVLTKKFEKAESEVVTLKEEIRKVHEEKDDVTVHYEKSLKTISELQQKLSEAEADNSRLNTEILMGSEKLKGAEDQCALMGKMNESLQLEAQSLAQKIAAADDELFRKQAEVDNLMVSLQEEHSRFEHVEATLRALQETHSQSQEEQRVLALELRTGLQIMKDLETSKRDLEAEIQQLMNENHSLNELNSSSSMSQKNLQEEMLRLIAIKEKIEAEVRCQAEKSDALQAQVHLLQAEIEGSYTRYRALVQQLESVGLDPVCFGSTVRGLQNENFRLSELSLKDKADREDLLKRLQEMEELIRKNTNLEHSLLEVGAELQISKEKANTLQESRDGLNGEKSVLVAEKSAILSQLKIITETMQSLLEKNTSLQTSLLGATAELEGLRAKSKGLEKFCQLLSSERSDLLAERSNLVSRLDIVEQKLEKLETRFTNLEDKYSGLEKEKHSTLSQVEELRFSLDIEKQERACLVLTSETRLSGLEGRIHDLQEENKYRKKEFEEQLEKAVNAQVEIFILQKFIQDMEDKNYTLLIECQRHAEKAKCSETLITELECENMIQQVEAEVLLDKINSLRAGVGQVLKALEIEHLRETEPVENFLAIITANIGNIKRSVSGSKDENQRLLVEKSIVSALLGQIHVDCAELTSRKVALEQESSMLTQQLVIMENEKRQLVDRSRELNLEIVEREKREDALKAEVKNLHTNKTQLQGDYFILQEENLNTIEQIRFLDKELLCTKQDKNILEQEKDTILANALSTYYLSAIFESYGIEKNLELDEVVKEMKSLSEAYQNLEDVAIGLEERLLGKELENLALKESLEKFEKQQYELSTSNDQLRLEISNVKELLSHKNTELEEFHQKLKATEDINTELCSTIQCLEKDNEGLDVMRAVLEKQIDGLSEQNKCQDNELLHLREANETLECKVGKLHEEIEECKIREVILTSELQERSSEFELWEAEAASFYFDLQLSSIREVLFQNKVYDLGSLCEGLEEVTNRRSVEIEMMKQRVASLENEAEALKTQLTTCLPLIASLKDNIGLIEKNPVLQSKLEAGPTTEDEAKSDVTDKSMVISLGFSELEKLQSRIQVIDDILKKEKENVAVQERAKANVRLEAALEDIEDLKSQILKKRLEEERYVRESVSETSEVRVGAAMKDIPLDQASGRSFHGMSRRCSTASDDQMLELWEAAEQDNSSDQLISEVQEHGTDTIEDEIVYTQSAAVDHTGYDPTPESQFEKELGVDKLEVPRRGTRTTQKGNKKIILDRLISDSQKLVSIQLSAQDLKRKLEPNKRRRKPEEAEYNTIRGQLEGVDNSVLQLLEMNTELKRSIDQSSTSSEATAEGHMNEAESVWQKRVSEQAKREAESISRLELEMQRLQYVLQRLKDEKKSQGKDGSRSSAAVLLRNFFYSRERKSKKQKKARFCGCLRPKAAKN